MASYTQGGGCYAASLRTQDHSNADQKKGAANGGAEGRHFSRFSAEALTSSRAGLKTHHRGKRSSRLALRSGPRIGVVAFLVLCIVSITIFGGNYLFSLIRNHAGRNGSFHSQDFLENQDGSSLLSFWNRRSNLGGHTKASTSHWENDREDYPQGKKKALHFGKPHAQNEELLGRDSRYWDRDDRIRDRDKDYEDAVVREITGQKNQGEVDSERLANSRRHKDHIDSGSHFDNVGFHDSVLDMDSDSKRIAAGRHSGSGSGGLYNERGRKELRMYEEQLEAALKQELDLSKANRAPGLYSDHERGDVDSNMSLGKKTSDGGSVLSTVTDLLNQTTANWKQDLFLEDGEDDDYSDAVSEIDQSELIDNEERRMEGEEEGLSHDNSHVREANVSVKLKANSKALSGIHTQESFSSKSQNLWTHQPSRKTKHRRHSASPCEINFLETTEGLQEPETSLRFQNFSLKYVELEYPPGIVGWEPRFAGHQSLAQRNQSFRAEDQTVQCGFVQAAGYPRTTGFDISEVDRQYLRTCRIAVSSCIFGSSDNVRSPRNRKLTGSFKKDVCFVMFVDQSTLDMMQEERQQVDEKGYLGPWKIVQVRNMPYMDARRVGKIPKFLTHRLFPAARYSIWLDSKLRLQNDPVLILEYFLWRGGFEYAISNHYDRHCVWEEVQQNKKLNKYNHTAIDEQFALYQADGLTRFNASDPRKPLPSNVPEGSFIIRAHTPMSNLFSCLWFNEVDRFTSRDQLSFAYTYMKFIRTNPDKHFYFNMFKDCERKTIAKLFRHRKSTSSSVEVIQ